MNPTTLSRLLDLNRQFYQAFALPFSATRQRLQPGVLRILEEHQPAPIADDAMKAMRKIVADAEKHG